MYCKNCGNKLQPVDKFCNQCGEKVLAETAASSFSPMFKQENEATLNVAEEKPVNRNFHVEDFNWDLDGYPSEQKKKTDEIDFNWESVLDEKAKRRKEERVPLFTEEEKVEVPSATPDEITAALEKEIFGTSSDEPNDMDKTVRIDKFYTFNKKNAEFQALLDKEYERLKSNGGEEEEELVTTEEILTAETADEDLVVVPEVLEETVTEEFLGQEIPAINEQEIVMDKTSEPTYVGVALAQTPESVFALEEAENEKSCPPSEENGKDYDEEKHKLTFDDVFSDDDDDSEKPKKKHMALRVIAIILCILIVIEIAVIVLTRFAPDSEITQWILSAFNSVKALITGDTIPKG